MSEPYRVNRQQLQQISDDEDDDKKKYAPNYDAFLRKIKPKLKLRITNHLTIREKEIHICAKKTKMYMAELLEKLGIISYAFMNETWEYDESMIAGITPEINKFIAEWNGPIISKLYKKNFNDPNVEMKAVELFSNKTKFYGNSRNWSDQNSYKVTGKFIAMHCERIYSYIEWCLQSVFMSKTQRAYIINRSWCYFKSELKSSTVKFTRSKPQPLIPRKALRDSVALHNYKALDIEQCARGNRRVKCALFAEIISKLFKDALSRSEAEENEYYDQYYPNYYGMRRGVDYSVSGARYTPYNMNHNQHLPAIQTTPPYFNYHEPNQMELMDGHIIGDFVEDIDFYDAPELSECITREMGVNAVNNAM